MDQFLLPRRFQRGITRPWENSGSVLSTKIGASAISLKTHHLRIYLMRADVPMVLLYSVVPSLAPERQKRLK